MDNEENKTSSIYPNYFKNMFTEIFGDKYARKFHEIYYANFKERDGLMKELYEEAKNDESLDKEQIKLITKCYVAYLYAVGKNCNYSIPIVSYINKKKPNLSKVLFNKSRFKRIFEDLQDRIDRTNLGLGSHNPILNVYNMPTIINNFLSLFNKDDLLEEEEYWPVECTLLVAFANYIRSLPLNEVVHIWYFMMFMKNIESFTKITKEDYDDNQQLKSQVSSIITTIYTISISELKRSGKPIKIKKKIESQAENIEANEEVKEEEPSHDI